MTGSYCAMLLASTAVAFAGPVAAQTMTNQTPSSAAQDAATIDDIVVTAQRRSERLLDVPVSVVATSGDRLERLNFNAATDLQYVTPGLTLGDANTPRGQGLRIRGVGSNVFADGIEQSVGTVVDGVPLARAGQGLADLIDLERVEVLRGPQGLLFGRNASAGLISITTRRPTEQLSGMLNASYGSLDEMNVGASLAGPVVEGRILGRLSGYLNKRDGFIDNRLTGQKINNREEYGFRGTVELRPTDTLEVLLRADYSRRDNECCVWSVRRFANATTDPRPGAAFLSTFVGPLETGPEARQIAANGEYSNLVTSQGISSEVNLQLGDYTLTSLTAYRTWEQADNNDADLSSSNILNRNFGANDLTQFSQELRLTSPADQAVEFVAGLFYFTSSNEGDFQQVGRFSLSLARLQNLGINAPVAPGVVLPASQLFGRDIASDIDVTDLAVFGQATWNVNEALSLTAGARVTRTEVSMNYGRTGTSGASAFNFLVGAAFAPLAFDASTEDTNVSWRVGAQYALDEDQNVYASVARGYKGPGFNSLLDIVIPAGVTAQNFTRVEPEVPTAYELGYKASLMDRRLSLTAALFLTDFENFQAQIVEFQPGSSIGSFAIRNAGELRTKGFELSLAAQPSSSLSFGASLAYTDATFESFANASCPRLGAIVTTVGAACGPAVAGGPNRTSFDASGLAVTNAPKWSGNADMRWEMPIRSDLGAFVQANLYWRSETTFGLYPANIPNPTIQDSYGILNASAGFDVGDNATISVFGKNLFDTNFVSSIGDLPFDAAGGLLQFVTPDARRTVGVQANLRF